MNRSARLQPVAALERSDNVAAWHSPGERHAFASLKRGYWNIRDRGQEVERIDLNPFGAR